VTYDDLSQNIGSGARARAEVEARLGGDMSLHHVGIVAPDDTLFETLRFMTNAGDDRSSEIAFRHVPEFQCDCYLLGRIELVVPNGVEGTPLHRWLLSRGRSLHHIAFEVEDLDAECERLRSAGVPVTLEAAVDGVAGLRVNFVHPSYCGFFVELVEKT
jgi:catechol 2,3-dioxygenase-like lactoylglutathione lyase family enzyme